MNDIPGFVYAKTLIDQAGATASWVASQARRDRLSKQGWRAYALMVTVMLFMSLAALDYAVPMKTIWPVFFYQDASGVSRFAISTESLPADLSDANIKAWLWQYLMHRESYSYTEAVYNHDIVESMSSDQVKAQYNPTVSGKNPDSYLAHYGKKAVIHIVPWEIAAFTPARPDEPGSITHHFRRYLKEDGQKMIKCELWTATYKFLQDYKRGLNISDIHTINPSRLVVTEYPGAEFLAACPPVPNTEAP